MGIHSFWHEGRYFRLHRKKQTFLDEGVTAAGGQQLKDKEDLVIATFGLSPGAWKPQIAFERAIEIQS